MSYLTYEEFDSLMNRFNNHGNLTVDTEGTLTHPFSETWGVSIAAGGVGDYFAFNHFLGDNLPLEWLPRVQKTILNAKSLTFHHAKHDLKALKNLGIDYQGPFYCTMIMAHMNNENYFSKELDYLCNHFGLERKRKSEVMDIIIKNMGWQYIPALTMREYGANDAIITEALRNHLWPDFVGQDFEGELWDWEMKFCRVLQKMETTGVLIDQDLAKRELERGLDIMDEMVEALGFNPGSTKQLGKFLLEDLGLPVVKETKKNGVKTGRPSFDKAAMTIYDELLRMRNDERARQVLIYRGWQKTTSSNYKPYLEMLGPDGRLRATFKQHGTHTGRLSCEKPNLQQIPRESPNDWNGKLKEAFIVEYGRTAYEFDYSQLEFRLGAAYGRVEKLIDVFNDPGRDIFTEMAKDNGLTRQNMKTLNYTIQFGGGADRISEVFGVSREAAKAIIGKYYKNYPGLAKVSNLAQQRALENGFVKYWTGRRRHFQFENEARKAFNSVCQGGAFEIVKRKMVELDEAGLNNKECKMELQVHDSIRFNIENGKEKEYLPEIKKIMEDIPQFGVDFRVDCKVWAKDEKVTIAA